MQDIILNPTDMLVIRVPEYYTKPDDGKINLTLEKDVIATVGIIEHIGEKIPKEWLYKVIYYHSGVATTINVLGIGVFDLVPSSLKLLIRLDQPKKLFINE